MTKEQLEQISNGFTFFFNGEEVEVTSVKTHPLSEEHSEVRLCKTDSYEIVGPLKKGFIAQYLEQTEQSVLLDLEIISAGQHIVNELGLTKIKIGSDKGLYEVSSKHRTWGGVGSKSLLELGRIAIESISTKDISTWLHVLNRLKKQENG